MGQIHNNQIKAGAAFSISGPYPIDDRLVVQSRTDLDSAKYTYEGIEIYVVDEQKSYKLTANGWSAVITESNLPSVDVSAEIDAHNTSEEAHADIRHLVNNSTGIIDVLELPVVDVKRNVIYRMLTAKFMTERALSEEKYGANWRCRCVETLPEVGDACTDAQMTFVDVYYSITDNAIYGYVDDELAHLFDTSSGWQSMENLCAIAGITWGGIITTKEEDSGDGSHYILLAYEFYTYQDGWTKLVMSQEKQPKFDIQWNGNTDGKFVLDMNPLGFDYTYFVKVSDEVFTVDELVGSQFMQTGGYICDIDTSNIDSESYPGALSLNDGVVICYDASTLNAVLSLPEGYITNGTYFVYVHDDEGYIMYTHRLIGRASITKIDSKYIDSTDILEDVNNTFDRLHSVAWTGDYNMLNNKPTIYTDVVRYDTVQNLSSSQKETARNNIDVYSKSEILDELPYSTNLSYIINEDNSAYSVTGVSNSDSLIVIPALYKGKPVRSIGDYAFNNRTFLTSIEIPDSVTSIGDSAFDYCTSLTSIEIPDSVTSIGNYAFRGCTSLTSVVIGDSVISIGTSAFSNCSKLTSIEIPDSVRVINHMTFSGCSSLTDVYYTGTEEQWRNIYIDDTNENLTNATIHYNYANDFITVHEKIDHISTDIPTALADLTDDETHRTVTDDEKLIWNAKSNFSGKYTDLTDIPTEFIPVEHSHDEYLEIEQAKTTYILLTEKGSKNGVATLDENGHVPSTQLPSYVDDVLEYSDKDSFPTTGESGKIYVALDTLKTYRWGGTEYVEISESLALGETESTAFDGKRGKVAYDHSQIAHAPTDAEKNQNAFSNVKVGDVTITADAVQSTVELVGQNITLTPDTENDKVTISLTKENVTTALGYTPPESDTQYTHPTHAAAAEGLYKVTVDELGHVTNVSNVTKTDITNLGIPAEDTQYSLPAAGAELGGVKTGGDVTITDGIIAVNSTFLDEVNSKTVDKITKIETSYGDFVNIDVDDVGVYWEQTFEIDSDGNYNQGQYAQKIPIVAGENITFEVDEENQVVKINHVPYSQGLEYTLINDRTCYFVTGIGTCTDTDIIIPSEYNGLPVTSIDYAAFRSCSGLTSIEIPDSITSIGYYAFYGCTSLTSIDIPDTVTSIGVSAFRDCSSLTSIEIPDLVTSIGESAFRECSSLMSVVIGTSVTSIGNYAFRGCTSLTSVVIGDSVTSIGDSAFEGCTALTNIEIPDSVTSIGAHAVRDCSSLTSAEIGDLVTSIGEYTFYNCQSLTSIEMPHSVTSIGGSAFRACTALADVYYTGAEEQWNMITIANNNDSLHNATIHYNYANDFISVNEKFEAKVDNSMIGDTNDLKTESKVIVEAINEVTANTISKITTINTRFDNRTNVDDAGDSIEWASDFALGTSEHDDYVIGTMLHSIPLTAGENVTFSYDEENNAIAINATVPTPTVIQFVTWEDED